MHRMGTRFLDVPGFEVRRWGSVKKGFTAFANGDVLLARITPCFENGKGGIPQGLPNGVGAGSTEHFVLRPKSRALSAKYLLALFKTQRFLIDGKTSMTGAVGQQRVPKHQVLGYSFPVAPYKEQLRIGAKLDSVLSKVDACRARLDRVPQILKRFREAVLEAAVSGKLTEEWREDNASKFGSGLAVIERDASAKKDLLEKIPWLLKKKSSIESALDAEYLFGIPESWAFSTWGVLSEWVTYGFTRPMPHAPTGVPLVTAKNVLKFQVKFDGTQNTTLVAFSELSEKDRPKRGDLLLTKDGTIGRAALVITDEPFCINQSVAVVWLRSTSIVRRYLELVANAAFTQRFIRDKAKGMAIQHLSITDFAQCPVPVPPREEQVEVVRRVDELLAFADGMERRYEDAVRCVEKLTPSVLAKAFRGGLVPQDPNDEPASVLLERVRRESEGSLGASKRKRRAKIERMSNPIKRPRIE